MHAHLSRTFIAAAALAVLCSCRHGPTEPAATTHSPPAGTSRTPATEGVGIPQPGHSGRAQLTDAPSRPPEPLAGPAEFVSIRNRKARSVALFAEASKVLLHPRCVNCHPADDIPRQGDLLTPHYPPVARGADNHGIPALRCNSCHQDQNLEHARVPGAPNWHLAPIEMAWIGRTPGQICAQLKDRDRNGGKTLVQIQEHMAHDKLVGWGWEPGWGRTPAPGTQAILGDLIQAWIDTGAECPPKEAR